MAIIKCNTCKKFYDDSKYDTCPHCSLQIEIPSAVEDDFNESKTLPMDEGETFYATDSEAKTQGLYDDVQEFDKTIGVYFTENDCNPVTAWLVCIQGTVRGKSFEVHMNRNFIGRDKLMDVTIPDDLLVSRNNHFSLVYDAKSNRYFAQPGEGEVRVNGDSLSVSVEIFENDVLAFGNSEYVFVPYCNERRNWNHEE